MSAHPPRATGAFNMAAKILLAVGGLFMVTGAGASTWIIQTDAFTLDRNTLVPLGAVAVVFLSGLGAWTKAIRMWDGRDREIETLKEGQQDLKNAVMGPEKDGLRRGGLVDKVDEILTKMRTWE